jgi:hypothetical protein
MDTLAEAKEAINRLFSDTTVSRGVTKGRLEELRDEIGTCLDTLSDVEAEDENEDEDEDDDDEDDDEDEDEDDE